MYVNNKYLGDTENYNYFIRVFILESDGGTVKLIDRNTDGKYDIIRVEYPRKIDDYI